MLSKTRLRRVAITALALTIGAPCAIAATPSDAPAPAPVASTAPPAATPATAAPLVTAAGAPGPAADSLYARMGGRPVVTAVVAETLDQVVADPRLNPPFRGSNIRRIKRLLAEQICELAGGGCTYSGDSMREVHANHHITEAQFYGVVEILRRSLRHHHVGLRERNELLALLAPMKRDIVEVTAPSNRPGG